MVLGGRGASSKLLRHMACMHLERIGACRAPPNSVTEDLAGARPSAVSAMAADMFQQFSMDNQDGNLLYEEPTIEEFSLGGVTAMVMVSH